MPAPSGQIPPPWAWWRTRLPARGLLAARPRLSRSSFDATAGGLEWEEWRNLQS